MTLPHVDSPDPSRDGCLAAPEVFTPRELSLAAGVAVSAVHRFIATADIPTVDGGLVAFADALEAVEALRSGRLLERAARPPALFGGALLRQAGTDPRSRRLSIAASTGLHALMLLAILVTTVTLTTADASDTDELPRLARLVFVAEPGPGGGGGGGGLRMPAPPPKAEREGTRAVSSPVPERLEPRRIEPVAAPEPPKALENTPLPPIFAPLAAAKADTRDVQGLLRELPDATSESQGPGSGGGVGDGGGTGIEDGSGAGVGPGSGGGTGGGPYRPGSGISPPRLLHEARPDYTEDARRRGIEGDVLLEIVVLSDGSVGSVQLVRRLGYGLDERALAAVRQWRFAPAQRFGEPVDVVVEVAMEFRLR